jgi:CHAT domain-containing protein
VVADPVFDRQDPRVAASSDGSAAPSPASGVYRSAKDSGVPVFERLLASRREAMAISALAGKTAHLTALDFEASRDTVLKPELGEYRIVHFASHGLLNSRHPALSGIVLSLVDRQGRPQNGFLQAHEIYNLRLNADLVVLSACQTALGKEVRGEGLIGLTRGFMYAGAPRVVASLWRVPDVATMELMRRFYHAMLVERRRPAAALRAAQRSIRADPRWTAPYYWAGFTLQGEWR